MPPKFEIKRQLLQRTDRVKGVDLHPSEPWLLANLYNGNVYIWSYQDQALVKSFEVTDLPVRSAHFVARKQWVITGSDDMMVRVYNYNTMDKVKTFEAHTDYIRCIAVHPTLPYILTTSDDMLIKLWDWDKGWSNIQVFEGHSHYVMQVSFNPKDTNTFASASLDRSIKVWSLGQPTPNFTLEGHEKGVNCVDYFQGGDRPFLISGGDDKLVKIWDYQTKTVIQTLEGHTHNISSVAFHPELPIIVTGSEDGTVKLWHNTTYRLETTLDYRMERVWAIAYCKGSNNLAIGYDEGATVIKIGREEPVASMDSSGKVIWAKHNEIQTVNIKSLGSEYEMVDGERLPLAVKDLGSCDLYPQSLQHNPNGRFVTVCGDGEYIMYTALAWRNKTFGQGAEFAWSSDSNEYVIREAGNKLKFFKNFQEKTTVKLDFTADGISGGALASARSAEFIVFYDWEGKLVRRIDVAAKAVHWADNGEHVAICGDTSFYILKYNGDLVEAHFAEGKTADDDGMDDAFELLNEISEVVKGGCWVGDCFIYNNSSWRLNYCVGGEVTTMYHLDRPMYLLGYLAAQNRVFLIDKDYGIISYTLLLAMVEFKTLIMRGDTGGALALLPSLPQDQLNTVARFLEAKGMLREALEAATDHEYKFDLAIQLGDLDTAQSIAEVVDSESKWKQLGELAMSSGKLDVAEECLTRAQDFSGLALLYAAKGSVEGMQQLAISSRAAGRNNVAFLALFLLGKPSECIDLLVETGRLPEAAFFARTYVPSRMSSVVAIWKKDLALQNPKAAESLADPGEYANLFPELELALKAEAYVAEKRQRGYAPADAFTDFEGSTMINLIQEMKDGNGNAEFEDAEDGGLADEDEEQEDEEDAVEEQEDEEDEQEQAAPAAPSPPPVPQAPPPPIPQAVSPPAPAAFSAAADDEEEEVEVEEEEVEDDEETSAATAHHAPSSTLTPAPTPVAASSTPADDSDALFGEDDADDSAVAAGAADDADDDWGLDEDDK